jgi:hypothetical protein
MSLQLAKYTSPSSILSQGQRRPRSFSEVNLLTIRRCDWGCMIACSVVYALNNLELV